ncbi:MAG: DUF1289 domain-containing protein [Azospirillum sp.]|nr:DUF1289 domain-containing protein [Azospirillum sp.]
MILDNSNVTSPCNRSCTLDARGDVCLGCLRTIQEILTWAGMSDAQRRRLMADLDRRREARGMAPS